MPSLKPARQHDRRKPVFGLMSRGWRYIAIAMVVGIALFVLVWMKQRGDRDFYRPDATTQGTSGRQFEPLPGPDMDVLGDRDAPQDAKDRPGDSARLMESTPPAPPGPPPSAPAPTTPQLPPEASSASTPSAETAPVPIDRPPPRYPRDALRRGESGEVLLRVEVDTNGRTTAVDVARGSGSRELDRAAQAAVRGWRFRPAQRNGQAVAGEVRVPIAFEAQR